MNDDWIAQAKARGLDGVLGTVLDTFAPLGPLAAQILWVAQPLLGVFGGDTTRAAINDVAEALETPEGIADLRERLRDDG